MLVVWVAKCRRNVTPYDVVRVLLAGVLLLAAGLKGHQLATEPVLGTGILDSRWFLIGVVEFELFLGLWLISGIYARRLWQITMGCFALFACFSLHKALSGAATCGCFGRVEVNPWYTFTLDTLAVALLLRWRPTPSKQPAIARLTPAAPQITALIGLWLLLAAPAAWAMGTYQPAVLAEDGIILGEDNLVILEPEKWEGKRFPLLEYIDISAQLAHGEWTVLLYHHDCPKCHEAVSQHVRRASQIGAISDGPGVALLEVPPFSTRGGGAAPELGAGLRGRLSETREWFVSTPVIFRIVDAQVTEVSFD